jgi:hypothetical protein
MCAQGALLLSSTQLCCSLRRWSSPRTPEMEIRIAVKFLKGETVVSDFIFVCSREQDLGSGVDAAVTFFRRQHADMSLFDTNIGISFEKN